MNDIDKGVVLLVAGMAVLFVFMGVMIVILHYFQKIAFRLDKK